MGESVRSRMSELSLTDPFDMVGVGVGKKTKSSTITCEL